MKTFTSTECDIVFPAVLAMGLSTKNVRNFDWFSTLPTYNTHIVFFFFLKCFSLPFGDTSHKGMAVLVSFPPVWSNFHLGCLFFSLLGRILCTVLEHIRLLYPNQATFDWVLVCIRCRRRLAWDKLARIIRVNFSNNTKKNASQVSALFSHWRYLVMEIYSQELKRPFPNQGDHTSV